MQFPCITRSLSLQNQFLKHAHCFLLFLSVIVASCKKSSNQPNPPVVPPVELRVQYLFIRGLDLSFTPEISQYNIAYKDNFGVCYWAPDCVAFKGVTATDCSPWENLTLFDFQNNALPAFDSLGKH